MGRPCFWKRTWSTWKKKKRKKKESWAVQSSTESAVPHSPITTEWAFLVLAASAAGGLVLSGKFVCGASRWTDGKSETNGRSRTNRRRYRSLTVTLLLGSARSGDAPVRAMNLTEANPPRRPGKRTRCFQSWCRNSVGASRTTRGLYLSR